MAQRILAYPFAFGFLSRPVLWNADSFVHSLHSLPSVKKSLQKHIPSPLGTSLFFAPTAQKKRYWNILESIFHPRIHAKITQLYQSPQVQSRGIVIDMALKHLFQTKYISPSHKTLFIPSPPLYAVYFSLYKYRKTPQYKTRYFLKRYAFHSYSSFPADV